MCVSPWPIEGRRFLSIAWRTIATGLSYVIFACVCVVVALLFFVVFAIAPGISAERRQRAARWCIGSLSRFFINFMRVVQLMRLRVENRHLLDTSGELIVANHPSLIDALFVTAYAPRLCCVVKPPLFSNPCTAYLVRAAGYLRSDSPTLLDEAAATVRGGDNLLLFPEGTRNTDDTTLAFKRGAAYVALAARCPVRPMTFDYYPRTLQKGSHWYDIPDRRALVTVKVLPSVSAVRHADADIPVTLAARRFTQELRDIFAREARGFALHATATLDRDASTRDAPGDVPATSPHMDDRT